MHPILEVSSRRLVLFGFAMGCSGCYAAVGPTVGVALPSGRPTAGFEASAATVTVARSMALDGPATPSSDPDPDPDPDLWTQRTYLVGEPFFGDTLDDENDAFRFAGGGPTLGMRWDELDDGSTRFGFAGGAWLGAGSALQARDGGGCGDDMRPYAVLVVGIRGEELYASPKIGVVQVPHLCISLGKL